MGRPKIFRDPVHGQFVYERLRPGATPPSEYPDKGLGWAVQSLVDCPAFQRLRHIRQDGLCNLVFQGAEHSRFTHSMGAAYLAREMYDRVVRNMDETPDSRLRTLTCLGALLHDVGHGPFSHTLEEILAAAGLPFHHEHMTVRLIEEDREIRDVLVQIDPTLPGELAELIAKGAGELRWPKPIAGGDGNPLGVPELFDKSRRRRDHWTQRLVSSQLDADRLDYLLRDALFAGVQGHGFDLPRLLDNLHHLDGRRIAVHRKALAAVEAYMLMQDQMYRAVYYHHAVRAASFLLGSVLRRALVLFRNGDQSVFPAGSSGAPHPFRALAQAGEALPIEDYVRLGEYHLWALVEDWQHARDRVLADLSRRLMRRALFKTMDVDPMDHEQLTRLETRARELVMAELSFVTEETVEHYVCVDTPSRSSYVPYDFRSDAPDESIWIVGIAEPCPIEDFTESRIVAALKDTKFFPRMIFPPEIREQEL
jgi:HD superfamily phosphohydrolase